MKTVFLLLVIASLSLFNAQAQCVPNSAHTAPGVHPDYLTNNTFACVGELFELMLTNVVPVDTTISVFGFPTTVDIDSVVVVSFTGLPPSMSYSCSSTLGGCSFAGGETGCILISGTPNQGEIGMYNPVVTIKAYAGGLQNPVGTQVVNSYYIFVNGAGNCINGLNENLTSSLHLFPNPAENTLTLGGVNTPSTISIVNMNGQVMNVYFTENSDSLNMNVENLEKGVYFVKIESHNSSDTIRFVKK